MENGEGSTDAPAPASAAFSDEAIATLVALTGGDEASARALLEATAGNVQQAADLFLAGGVPPSSADVERDAALARSLAGGNGNGNGDAAATAAATAAGPFGPHAAATGDDDEDQPVRAPIPVMRDTLYGPAATYYRGGGVGVVVAGGGVGGPSNGAAAAATAAGGGRSDAPPHMPQRRPNDRRQHAAAAFSSVDDRAAGAPSAPGSKNPTSSSSSRRPNAPPLPSQPPPTKGLAGLFAPPADLLFAGDFQQAAEAAAQARRWLVANVQCEAEFASHRLNRDAWGDPALRLLLRESFVFWQGDLSAEDGATVAQHYRLLPPAVAEAAVEAASSSGRGGGGGGRGRGEEGDPRQRHQHRPPTPAEVAKLVPAGALPAILVVDPATGLAMRTWTGFVPADRLAEELVPFLDHAFDEPGARELAASGAAAARRRRQAEAAAAGSAAAAAAVAGRAMTEDEELAAALALSAAEAQGAGGGGQGGDDDDEDEEEEEEEEEDDDFAAAGDADEILEDEPAEADKEEEEAPAPPPRPSSPPPVVAPEPPEGAPRLSVAVRLPDGSRASRAFAKKSDGDKNGATLADLFEWCRSLLLEEQQEGENKQGSRRKFSLKEPFPGAVPVAREGAEGVSLESVCGGGGATFLLHFVD